MKIWLVTCAVAEWGQNLPHGTENGIEYLVSSFVSVFTLKLEYRDNNNQCSYFVCVSFVINYISLS